MRFVVKDVKQQQQREVELNHTADDDVIELTNETTVVRAKEKKQRTKVGNV
jgi:hypothetical protein